MASYIFLLFIKLFLDFTIGQHVKRIAYAASFGTSKWEFTEGQTTRCAALAKQFDAISVREDSGVVLCKNTWVLMLSIC